MELVFHKENKAKLLQGVPYMTVDEGESSVDFSLGSTKEDAIKIIRGLTPYFQKDGVDEP